jgi:NAD(P)-dependent dehydrogenase (short-subunit alcohol dehydrogenase family)
MPLCQAHGHGPAHDPGAAKSNGYRPRHGTFAGCDPSIMTAQTALGHLVDPRDVGHAVAFLLSERARSITGAVLPVDAGTLISQLWSLYGGLPA